MKERDVRAAYRVFRLNFGANRQEVRAARIALARRFHPDLHPGNRDKANECLAKVNAAHDCVVQYLKASGREKEAKRERPRKAKGATVREEAARTVYTPQARAALKAAEAAFAAARHCFDDGARATTQRYA